MDFSDFFVLIATVLTWVKKIIVALGLSEKASDLINNIDNALGRLDTEPNTST